MLVAANRRIDLPLKSSPTLLLRRGPPPSLESANTALIAAIEQARKAGADDDKLRTAREMHRRAQWRLDFVSAENSTGFHAPQEALRILAEAIDDTRQGQAAATSLAVRSRARMRKAS